MAEYYISYKDLEGVIDDFIRSTDNTILMEHKAEILSALTGDFDLNDMDNVNKTVAFWQSEIAKPSQLLLGNRYIRIQQVLLEFLKLALTSGLIDAVIIWVSEGNWSGFTLSVGSNIAFTLWSLFTSVKKLDDWDFCVYMQAVSHFREHKDFCFDDMLDWFPSEPNITCNMHNTIWNCEYLDHDTCTIIAKNKLIYALNSLCEKGLLSCRKENNENIYCFKK